jgi:penicillin-binding protein 1A
MLRLLSWIFGALFVTVLGLAGAALYIVWDVSKDLPDYKQLAAYEPPVLTRIHASDGSLLAEYAEQRRLFVPYNAIPKKLIEAYISAEDKTFFEHSGLDYQGILAAAMRYAQVKMLGRRGQIVGASTITQQVAKNFLLTNEQTISRKLKEAMLVKRIEEAYSKERIMELYLNEIFLGLNSYGVAAASLNYFGKALADLSLEEMAYLAALPKGPNNYHPYRQAKRAVERRNWVLEQMRDNKYITDAEMATAQAKTFEVNPRPFGGKLFAADGFAEEVRRELVAQFGKDGMSRGGFSVRTTLDPRMQILARQALASGLTQLDRIRGYRGPFAQTELTGGDWGKNFNGHKLPLDLAPWRLAIVLQLEPEKATIGLQPAVDKAEDRETAVIPLANMLWARKFMDGSELGKDIKKPSEVVREGDIVMVMPAATAGEYHLMQMPDIEGGLVAMDPHTGRVLAMAGGFSYGASQFNRVTQALRQPGSAFKPIVYAAALDNGYTPSSVILDAPIEFKLTNGKVWRPKNYQEQFYGPSTLRRGIEQSRNAMTVRLADDLGITKIADLSQRLGIYDKMPMRLAYSLGAGETTLLRMTTAYAMFANGGRKLEPSLIDRIQDRRGKAVYRHDKRDCTTCNAERFEEGMADPEIIETRDQVMSPYTAYQITSMLEGVVERGTGQKMKFVGKPVAGKTGTTNEERDAWFVGYTPDLVVGVYVGYDNPKPMGKKRTGGEIAAPIVADFMKSALEGKAAVPFRVPREIELIPIDAKSGRRSIYGKTEVILEAFKPGDEPPSNVSVIGQNTRKAKPKPKAGEGVVLVAPSRKATPKPASSLTESGGGLY